MSKLALTWVEKMLQELQVTSAPSSIRVSMRTAVWMVMWRQPAILAPARGFFGPYTVLRCISPGISFSARLSSLRPQSAREMSARGRSHVRHCYKIGRFLKLESHVLNFWWYSLMGLMAGIVMMNPEIDSPTL